MKTIYYPKDDILVIHLSDDPVVKEVSQSWNVNISYTASGAIAEIVILEAHEKGLFPVEAQTTAEVDSSYIPLPDQLFSKAIASHSKIIRAKAASQVP